MDNAWKSDHPIQYNEGQLRRYHEKRAQGMNRYEAQGYSIQAIENWRRYQRERHHLDFTNAKFAILCSACRKRWLMASGFRGKQKHRTKRNWYRRMKAIKRKGK